MTVSLLGCIADDYTGATDLSSMLVRAGLRVKFLHKRGVTKIIVAGGETSGSVINALDIKTVRIGAEIAPGVPWITILDEPRISLALKSGNFGGPRFFLDALEQAS